MLGNSIVLLGTHVATQTILDECVRADVDLLQGSDGAAGLIFLLGIRVAAEVKHIIMSRRWVQNTILLLGAHAPAGNHQIACTEDNAAELKPVAKNSCSRSSNFC